MFLAPEGEDVGFGLTGLSRLGVSPEDAEAALLSAMDNPAVGLVIMDERLSAGISEDRLKEIEAHWGGVLLLLPAPGEAVSDEEDFATRIIRKAIGYHVRIRP